MFERCRRRAAKSFPKESVPPTGVTMNNLVNGRSAVSKVEEAYSSPSIAVKAHGEGWAYVDRRKIPC